MKKIKFKGCTYDEFRTSDEREGIESQCGECNFRPAEHTRIQWKACVAGVENRSKEWNEF